eukprot:m.56691 g.56691  ORF g.56691 m.56691 type:complete len:61 (-) comp12053_c0_seq1:140-322(-)
MHQRRARGRPAGHRNIPTTAEEKVCFVYMVLDFWSFFRILLDKCWMPRSLVTRQNTKKLF